MTDRLRDHLDDLSALVSRTASARGLPAAYVEKDFWVTEVLRAAAAERTVALPDGGAAPVRFLFKGGTSLSRVFGIVARFSEDVDLLAVFPENATMSARHRILKQVDVEVTAHLGLTTASVFVEASTTGVKRFTTYQYPRHLADDGLKEGVLLELGTRGGACPAESHRYSSMVADYAIAKLGESQGTWEEFAAFEVSVLAPERTLLEKMAALHGAAVRDDTQTLLKHGRHYYDIHRLLATPRVTDALTHLGPAGLAELVRDIDAHSQQAEFDWSPRPDGGYADSPAFDPGAELYEVIREGFSAAQSLVYGERVTLEDVLATVQRNRSRL